MLSGVVRPCRMCASNGQDCRWQPSCRLLIWGPVRLRRTRRRSSWNFWWSRGIPRRLGAPEPLPLSVQLSRIMPHASPAWSRLSAALGVGPPGLFATASATSSLRRLIRQRRSRRHPSKRLSPNAFCHALRRCGPQWCRPSRSVAAWRRPSIVTVIIPQRRPQCRHPSRLLGRPLAKSHVRPSQPQVDRRTVGLVDPVAVPFELASSEWFDLTNAPIPSSVLERI